MYDTIMHHVLSLWSHSRKAPAAQSRLFLCHPHILTIHTPSNGTLSWYFCRLSYHHSCVTLLEKSGYAVKPGQTYKPPTWFSIKAGSTRADASTRAHKFNINGRYFQRRNEMVIIQKITLSSIDQSNGRKFIQKVLTRIKCNFKCM